MTPPPRHPFVVPRLWVLLLCLAALPVPSWAGTRKDIKTGDAYLAQGEPRAALKFYEKAREKRPDDPELLLRIARASLAAGDYGQAIAPAREAMDAGLVEATVVLLQALQAAGEWKEAQKIGQTALAQSDTPALRLTLAQILISARAFPDASDLLEGMESPEAEVLRGYALIRQGRADEALALATRARNAAADHVEVLMDSATVFFLVGDQSSTRAAVESARTAAAPRVDALTLAEDWMNEATRLANLNDLEGALRFAFRAYLWKPDDAEVCRRLGIWSLKSEQYALAADLLGRALSLPPYAFEQVAEGLFVAAITPIPPDRLRDYRREAGLALAEAHLALRQPVQEAEAMALVIKAQGSDASATDLLRYAEALERARRPKEALYYAELAVDRDPDLVQASYRVARSHAANGQVGRAMVYAQQAWEGLPGDPAVALLLCDLYLSQRNTADALRVLEVAIRAHPGHPNLTQARGRVLEAQAAEY